jgi:hypothetical protein
MSTVISPRLRSAGKTTGRHFVPSFRRGQPANKNSSVSVQLEGQRLKLMNTQLFGQELHLNPETFLLDTAFNFLPKKHLSDFC